MPETLTAPVTLHGVTLDLEAAAVPDGYELLHATPLLENTASTGRKKYWQGFAVADYVGSYTRTVSFQETKDGVSALNVSALKRVQGKNVGRSNETTPAEQAVSEITSHEARQRDKKYRGLGEAPAKADPLPMLAHPFEKRGHDIQWPAYVQPKLDGVRMVSDGERGWSRGGKDYIPEVVAHLMTGPLYYEPTGHAISAEPVEGAARVFLDGEMILDPQKYTFQETIRAVKKYRETGASRELEYHVYDVILEGLPEAPFSERLAVLELVFQEATINGGAPFRSPNGARTPNIRLVPSTLVESEGAMRSLHDAFVALGQEGAMVRNAAGPYKLKDRSADLQKVKVFCQEEFEITGVLEGSGKDEGTAVFLCATDDGKPFNARPKGTHAQRKAFFEKGERLVGEKVSVRYFGLSEDGIPRFPVAVGVRPDWDQ